MKQWQRKWKSDPESTCGSGSTPKNNFYRGHPFPCPCLPCLIDTRCCDRELSCSQTERQTDRMTERTKT